jgi:citrate lyase subunit beta/citryl-CoA lyase
MRTVDRLLKRHERSGGLRSGCISVIATIESAIGLRNAFDIASAADRLVGLIPAIGAGGDLQRDLGYTTTVDQRGLLYARSRVVLAARAAGVVPLDGVHVGLDLGSFERSARAARVLGYRGKKIFHHAHVKAANRIFDL